MTRHHPAVLDHAVVGVVDLDGAIEQWTAAGLTLAARGRATSEATAALYALPGRASVAWMEAAGGGSVRLVETPLHSRRYRPLDRRPRAVILEGPRPATPPDASRWLPSARSPTHLRWSGVHFTVLGDAATATLDALGSNLTRSEPVPRARDSGGFGAPRIVLEPVDPETDAGTLPTMPLHPGLHAAAILVADLDAWPRLDDVAWGDIVPVTSPRHGACRARTLEVSGSVRLELWQDGSVQTRR